MQTSYGFSGLLCFSKTNTNSHSHSAPALYLTTRAEARVGGNSCRQSFRATRTSSWMLTCIVKCFKAHPMPTQTTKACQNMPPQCSCLSMQKLSRFVKNSVHAKVSSRSTQLDCCSREPKGKQKESYFSSFWAHESLSLTGETKPTGYLPFGRYWEAGCPLFHQLHRQPDHPLHWSSPPVH